MKICLYLEFYHFLGGILFKKIGTGLLSSYRNQIRALKFLNIPYTEKWASDCDILQINTPWIKSLYLMRLARKHGKKIIIWAHVTVEDAMQVFRFMPLVAPVFKKYLTYAYGKGDIIFCPSEYTKTLLLAYGLPTEKLVVLSNGVDTNLYHASEEKRNFMRRQYGIEGLAVGTVGLVLPRKGTDTFVYLAKEFPRNKFFWFGKIYSGLLVKPPPKELPPNVLFSGFVSDVTAALNALDIFIFPSYEENEGMVILEAAAIGLPIVVRDILAYKGWLEHGENCLKAKSNEEFKRYIEMLLEDKNMRLKLGHGAKILAENKSIEALSKKVMDIYAKLG